MAALPNLDWRKQNATYSADDARVQGLLAADGTYTGKIDGLRGPKSVAALDASQIKHNCGGPGKTPDRLIGLKTWGSLLSGKVW